MTDASRILKDAAQGDPQAASQLLPLVYDELRKLAAQRLALEKPGQTLDATALGKVQIQVQADAGTISARVEVQTPAAQKTLLDNISLLHDAIGQTGATVGHIEIEVAPQPQNANDAHQQRDDGSGQQQQDAGNANSQNQSNQSGGGNQQQNSGRRSNAAIDEIDIDI